MPAAKFEIIRNCQVCGEQFLAKTIDSIYCSTRCSGIAYKRRKAEEQKTKKLNEIVKKISDKKDYIKVTEALDTDFAMLLAYNVDKQEAIYDMTSTCRGDEGTSLSYPSNWVGDKVHIYLAFVSEDGTLVSDSVYVGSETIE